MRDMFIGGGIVLAVFIVVGACSSKPHAEKSIDIEPRPSVLQPLPSHVSTLRVYMLKRTNGNACYVVEYTAGYGGVSVACP